MAINYVWPDTEINITHLPLSNSLCANDTCLAFAKAHEASQQLISWGSQFDYGWYVCFFWATILGAFILIGSANRLHYFYTARSSMYPVKDKSTAGEKFVAIGRSITYRRPSGRIAKLKSLPSLGLATLVLSSCLFAVFACFIQHPFYRHNRGYGAPPLGVRAGLAGTAMTPITVALSGKYNLVTLLTGISHEKLNFLHRWCGIVYLFFGIVHTIPFLVNAYRSGGSKRLYYQFYYPGSMEYTGIAPFAILIFLCLFSASWFRHKWYELFAHSHVAAAIAFLGTMFWHTGNTGDSWTYLWATVAIWVVQLAARAWEKTSIFELRKRKRNTTALVRVLDDDQGQATMLRISIVSSIAWTPGQHAFLRFPTLSILDNHPFTITSVQSEVDTADQTNELLFFVRPCGGITKRLLQHATKGVASEKIDKQELGPSPRIRTKAQCSIGVSIDGPYGGLEQHRAIHRLYDGIILVAGGGGISAMLPWVMALSAHISDPDEPCRVQRVDLIWCIRHASARAWVDEELQQCLRRAGSSVHADIYVTDVRPKDVSKDNSMFDKFLLDGEKMIQVGDVGLGPGERETSHMRRLSSIGDGIHIHAGRPYLPEVLPNLLESRRVMIMGCGPDSLKIDLSNAAAQLQSKVLDNEADEVALHTETFGW